MNTVNQLPKAGITNVLFPWEGKELKTRKPVNTQVHVEVPSAQHVAAIVGKGGAKIKDLRARTSTYIKTPSCGQPHVFIIVGREPGVTEANDFIQAASYRITCQLMKSEETLSSGIKCSMSQAVPSEAVGLVLGYHNRTLMDIEKITSTAIQAPTTSSRPIFKVFGSPRNAVVAKDYIIHMAERMSLSRELREAPLPEYLAFPLHNQPKQLQLAVTPAQPSLYQSQCSPMTDKPFTQIRRRVQSPTFNLPYPICFSPPLCSPQCGTIGRPRGP